MLRKILIANRGEIAVRVIRACAEMGIRSAAIYSEADRHSLHVKKADEAYSLGSDPLAGYLNVHNIVNLALATGCDAVHPGYGFLSENPELARDCARRGITFIGPIAEVIARMGDKTEARLAMQKAGVPVTPGSPGNLENLDAALRFADEIGYPIMLKATSGGGGRGIRRCDDADALRNNYERVISEATKAFGRAEVFLEKCVVNPKHIEVQVLGDHHGNCVHLFERDCSIQRRNQKLIEIAPSPQLDEAERAVCRWAGGAGGAAVGYTNAGTVEFLRDSDGRFYFMEMNTRIQVEHTITETDHRRRPGGGTDPHRRRTAAALSAARNPAARLRHAVPDQCRGSQEQLPAELRAHLALLRPRRSGRAHRWGHLYRLHGPAPL